MHLPRLGILGVVVVLILLASQSAHSADEERAGQLFNGRDLSGWTAFPAAGDNAKATWSIKDGVLHCTGAPNGYLRTDRAFTNFVLRLQWRWTDKPGNSGVLMRTQPPDAVWPKCLEAQLMADNAGDILAVAGFQASRAKKQKPSNEKPVGEWNSYEITLDGGRCELKVNGVVQSSIDDAQVVAGTIGLQSEGAPIEFRNVELTPLGDDAKPSASAMPAADAPARRRLPGLDGWHVTGHGDWSYRDGVIEGRQDKAERRYTHLVTDRSYRNFTASVRYKAVRGNSGLYFRVRPDADGNMRGFQAEIDAEVDAGGIYESGGRGWVSQPRPADVARYFRPGDWNEMTVEADGPHVTVRVNGVTSAEVHDDNTSMEGPLALQLHGGQDVHVMFADIRITENP